MIPGVRVNRAMELGVARKMLFHTWGGLGDQACAEPTLRYALKAFPNCEISLATECPELFEHLKFKRVFRLAEEQPIWGGYLVFPTIVPPTHLLWEFVSHCISHPVDFTSICALRCQLPVVDREIVMPWQHKPPGWLEGLFEEEEPYRKTVVLHAGKHWPSKTFPAEWWQAVQEGLVSKGFTPLLIGKKVDKNVGYVEIPDHIKSVDARDKLSLADLIGVLTHARVVVSNDSAPVHIASAGSAHIGFVASCKHPDYLYHWRKGQWAWRMQNLGRDGMWNYIDQNPAQEKDVTVENIEDGLMEKILPPPEEVVQWVSSRQ